MSSDLISETFRDAKTFKPNETNSYETSYFHFMISEKGFAVYKKPNYSNKNKPKKDETQNVDENDSENANSTEVEHKEKDTADQVFYRILRMYLLALAYNQKMDRLSNDMARIFASSNLRLNDTDNLENFITNIHAFDLQYFFENPVKMDRYQTYNLWNIIANNYNVKAKHYEIKSQVLALADIISRNKDKKQLIFEKKIKNRITTIGITLALIPIILEIPIPYSRLLEIDIINKLIIYFKKFASFGFEIIKAILNGLTQ